MKKKEKNGEKSGFFNSEHKDYIKDLLNKRKSYEPKQQAKETKNDQYENIDDLIFSKIDSKIQRKEII